MDSIGVVVNPIAGMGGRVGLKGTDDKVDEAIERGAEPRAPGRANEALESLHERDPDLTVYTAGDVLGENAAREAGYDPEVVYRPEDDDAGTDDDDGAAGDGGADGNGAGTGDGAGTADATGGDDGDATAVTSTDGSARTDAEDTRAAVRAFLERGVDLVLFVGGDGTAVDVAEVLEERDAETPMLGIPAGVKIYSSVFGVSPADAGRIAATSDQVEDREVNDIDEEAYREGEVRAELRAVVPVPVAEGVQSSKQLSSGSVETLAAGFTRDVDPERTYVFGPGSTVGAIQEELGVDPSPLGVDVWRDGEVLARDASEEEILAVLESPATVVVSPIGGQGFVFGRGNHQISPAVLERIDDLEVVASGEKLDRIGALRVDTDDEEVDEELRGWQRVRTGRFTTRLVKVV